MQWSNSPAPPQQQSGSTPPGYPHASDQGLGGQLSYPGQQPYGQPAFGPGQPLAPPRKKRTRLWVAIGAAAAVVALVVAGVLVFTGGDSNKGAKTAGEAVQGYLEALARGDAEAALSFAEAPPDTTFLTDEILKIQIEKYPITNIKILGDVPDGAGGAEVSVAANFGDSQSTETFTLPKPDDGQGWKLEHATVVVSLGKDSSIQMPELADVVTLFGQPAPKTGKAYVFPGWVDLGSSNPNIDVATKKEAPPTLRDFAWGLSSEYRPRFEVSEAGRKAIRAQLQAMVDECVKSNLIAPPNCPNGTPPIGDYLIEGTAQWTVNSKLDEAIDMPYLDIQTATVRFWGSVKFGLKVQTTAKNIPVYETTTSGSIDGEADMLQTPPKITLEK